MFSSCSLSSGDLFRPGWTVARLAFFRPPPESLISGKEMAL
jgi:hypothetical protein